MFGSADPDHFIAHDDVTRFSEYRQEAVKLAGEPSLARLLRRLSISRLVTIAEIEGRVRGAGSEFVLACDMRFAARETAIFGQFEAAFGVIPGAGGTQHLARLMGRARALEVMLSAQDYDADLAERYGWINRGARLVRQCARPPDRQPPSRRPRGGKGAYQCYRARAGRRIPTRFRPLWRRCAHARVPEPDASRPQMGLPDAGRGAGAAPTAGRGGVSPTSLTIAAALRV
ncbi:hypothetical protein MES5069_660003 [Mesorhizobium escarrei]|uniref:Enoyl-CoA hydratase/isomerase family protein n=1 Tax=Mesorhizobium escarrei TaxID=666018 RepID=A0ABN8KF01_9HYPH|nr:hypothetical protein MES5069_660003 [Mesorhizobium escarrei]